MLFLSNENFEFPCPTSLFLCYANVPWSRAVLTNPFYPQTFSLFPLTDMREVAVHRAGLGYLTRYLNLVQDLKVRLGDNVELECSTSASEAPEYFWAKEVTDLISNALAFLFPSFFLQFLLNMMHYCVYYKTAVLGMQLPVFM